MSEKTQKERGGEAKAEREPTVYIVDDDLDMRDSLQWLMKTVGLRAEVFPSASTFLEGFKPGVPGCLVFDVRMPGTSGLDLYEELVARGEGMPVIFITAFADVPMAIRAMKSGAIEFVEKPFNRQALLDRVQRAIKNDVERLRIKADREDSLRKFRLLTDKEREVLALIKEGQPNKAISMSLGITPRAVEMRRAGLMKKLGVRNFAELLRLTIEVEATIGGRVAGPR
ncbi:response regulator transcription factor [Singulisphaera acidiphila]|uniref:Response regulator n=1 Tax=Singulisphaera acidiphila (strain ATCC BAA-1392 / DSM 18658 / VKM B-2454 / MOB10) TaxID=886293 RepID=L0DKW9_SINAD|nr:response regulator [Singulisphaera acidiphila]AGA29877.1 response regulator [Singulisphaera acidiphila DSM 18658]